MLLIIGLKMNDDMERPLLDEARGNPDQRPDWPNLEGVVWEEVEA